MKKTPHLFDSSNEKIKDIEFCQWKLPEVQIWDFRWYFEGVNVGQEISKDWNMKRPCMIIKIIPSSSLIWILPTTTKIISKPHQFHLSKWKDHGLKKESSLLIYQQKCIDKKRLFEKISWKRAWRGLIKLLKCRQ